MVGCVDAIAKRDGRVRRINNEKLGEAHFDQRTDCAEAVSNLLINSC